MDQKAAAAGSPSSLVMAATAAAQEAAALAQEAAVLAREARQREPMAQQVVQHLAQVGIWAGGSSRRAFSFILFQT